MTKSSFLCFFGHFILLPVLAIFYAAAIYYYYTFIEYPFGVFVNTVWDAQKSDINSVSRPHTGYIQI